MNMRDSRELEDKISKLAETLAGIQERAVIEYTPLVDDICSRKAKEDEVDNLLTWMFDFVGNEKMIVSAKRYHHSGVSGTIVSLEAVPL